MATAPWAREKQMKPQWNARAPRTVPRAYQPLQPILYEIERDDIDEAENEAVRHGLRAHAKGKDRLVLIFHDRVVKIPRHEQGRRANLSEIDLWKHKPATWTRFVMPIYAADPQGRWIVAGRSEGQPSKHFLAALRRADLLRSNVSKPVAVPRALMQHVEHSAQEDQWGVFDGRPVLMDYAFDWRR